MAELAISSASVLVRLLTPFLTKYLHDDQDLVTELKSMEGWLEGMKTFIEMNGGHECSGTMKDQLVKQFRDIAYDIEDIFEEFVRHSPHVFNKDMRGKIATIKKSLTDIKLKNEIFLTESSSTIKPIPRVSPLLEDELVGYEKERLELDHEIIEGEKRLVTLAVGGPGGSGKTTFTKTVFWKHRIQGRFDCNAWVHVSRHFDEEKILVNLLKQLCVSRKEPYPAADESLTIQEKIRKYLGKKSFIVVLDDIWRAQDWHDIKDAFPNAYCGSRIIVTTRDFSVASICASSDSYIYPLNGLEWLHSWTLFCNKAFQNSNKECPSELNDCSVQILKLCEGLPLAIVAVGSALAQKQKTSHSWEKFYLNLGCELESDSHLSVISNTLLQSYLDLSSSIKSCFLFFSIFPEDYSVEHGRLLRLWVAERFAIGTDNKTAEEVAADYLNELVYRNLVHVSDWYLDGRPKCCRVINLVRKFIIQKCKYENFATIFTEENTSASNKIRRLSFQGYCSGMSAKFDTNGVRSLLLFRCTYGSPNYIWFWNNTRRFQLSRVIDFDGAPLLEFPRYITDLTLLTYVCFRGTKIKTIPKSIHKLVHLETLDLKQTNVTELPKELSKLHKLRHLLVYKYNVEGYEQFDSVQTVKVFEGIGNLTQLQKLSFVRIGRKFGALTDLRKLSRLRKLGLSGIKMEHWTNLCRSIEGMRNLSTLDLTSNTRDEYLHLEEISSPHDTLQRLYLKGRMKCIPSWINKLRNLVKLGLKWTKMEINPLESLRCLPDLLELVLIDSYVGEELVFEASRLKKLKILIIHDFPRLDTIIIQEGSIPDLQEMTIRICPNLLMPPSGVEYLSKLKELFLYDMVEEFVRRIRMGGDYRRMIQHIPIIHSFTLKACCLSLENLSTSSIVEDLLLEIQDTLAKHDEHEESMRISRVARP